MELLVLGRKQLGMRINEVRIWVERESAVGCGWGKPLSQVLARKKQGLCLHSA